MVFEKIESPFWFVWAVFVVSVLVAHVWFQAPEKYIPEFYVPEQIKIEEGKIPGEFFTTEVGGRTCTLWRINKDHAAMDCELVPTTTSTP